MKPITNPYFWSGCFLFFLTIAVSGALVFAPVKSACAGAFPAAAQSACDPEYMDALEARAYTEAHREVAQNKNIIAKPDSVLELACFDRQLDTLASLAAADALFSENQSLWGPINIPGSLRLLLIGAVSVPLSTYINANFAGDYVDNRTGIDAPGDTYDGNVNAGGIYNCAEMGALWRAAVCIHFQNQIRDEFYHLGWYAAGDPRTGTPYQACSPPAGNIITNNIAQMSNGNTTPYTVGNANTFAVGSYYLEDPVQTFLTYIDPTTCAPGVMIPTGITVQRMNFAPNSYAEMVCPNPGCWYDATANNCVP